MPRSSPTPWQQLLPLAMLLAVAGIGLPLPSDAARAVPSSTNKDSEPATPASGVAPSAVDQPTTSWARKHSPAEPVPAAAPRSEPASNTPFSAGVANFEPVYWDMNASIAKAVSFIEQAGEQGVKLLLFPEGAIAGYPWFNWFSLTWDMADNEHVNQHFMDNSPQIGPDGGDLKPIMEAARRARVNVALPINERDNKGSEAAIFNSLVFIDLNGNIVGRHRKTVPSYTERMWWSFGNGDDLVVVDMPEVGRVCGLLCWENYMTLAKYTLMTQGCEFWMIPTQDIGPHAVAAAQAIAREARAYTLSATQMFRPEVAANSELGQIGNWGKVLLENFRFLSNASTFLTSDGQPLHMGGWTATDEQLDSEWFMDGQAMIANPDGFLVAGPVYSGGNFATRDNYYTVDWAADGCPPLYRGMNEVTTLHSPCGLINVTGPRVHADEVIVTQRISRGEVQRKKLYMDAVGNYARPDIWSFVWHNQPRDVAFTDAPVRGNGLFTYDVKEGAPAFSRYGDLPTEELVVRLGGKGSEEDASAP